MDKQNTNESKALVAVARTEAGSGYWARTAGAYTLIFRAFLIALPLFVIVFMALCAQAFTKNSIYSFAMDLRSVASFVPSDYHDVSYTYVEGERVVCAYRDGVAVATSDGIEVYSPDGARLLNVPKEWSAPRMSASQKYLVGYDFGTKRFVVADAYSVLFEGECEFPILHASVSDTGHFALVTSSNTHLSQILLYDANFRLIECFSRSSATTDVAFSPNGKLISFGGIYTENGVPKSLVQTYRIGAEEPLWSFSAEELFTHISFTDSRHLALLSDSALRVLDSDGDAVYTLPFEKGVVTQFLANEQGVMLVLRTSELHATHRVLLLDDHADVLLEKNWQGEILGAAFEEQSVFLLTEDEIVKTDVQSGEWQRRPCAKGAGAIWAVGENALRVAYAGEALYVEFD